MPGAKCATRWFHVGSATPSYQIELLLEGLKVLNSSSQTDQSGHLKGRVPFISMYFPSTGEKNNRIFKYHWLRSPISLRGCWHLCWVLRPVTARLALPSAYYTWFGSTQKKTTSFKWDWIRYCMTTLNAPNHQKVVCCSQTWVGLDGPFSWSLKWWYQIYQFETRGLWLSFAAQQDQRMRRSANGVSFSDFFGNYLNCKKVERNEHAKQMPT